MENESYTVKSMINDLNELLYISRFMYTKDKESYHIIKKMIKDYNNGNPMNKYINEDEI